MSRDQLMMKELKAVFKEQGITNRCMEQFNGTLFYIEDTSRSRILREEVEEERRGTCFLVRNEQQKNLTFIPIDGGLIGRARSISRCDFVIFDDRVFCFVEMKLNASSDTPLRIEKTRHGAVTQLEASIHFFKENFTHQSKDFLSYGYDFEAIVSTPPIYPRNNAAFKRLATLFLEDNGVPLIEASEKDFSEIPSETPVETGNEDSNTDQVAAQPDGEDTTSEQAPENPSTT